MPVRFKPNKKMGNDGIPSNFTNNQKAEQANAAIDAYLASFHQARHVDSDEAWISDLLTDLMHFCDREEISFDDALETAVSNHEAEQ